MDLKKLAEAINAETAQAFVHAARNVVDAMLIEAVRVEQTQTPGKRDYDSAELSRSTPGGGWLSHGDLRDATQKMAEAIATEKWTDGVTFAIKLFVQLGAI